MHVGEMQDNTTHDKATTWAVSYLQGLGEHFAVSLMYLNEGHVPGHHRDGYAPQLWVRKNIFDRHLSLSVGAGPYFYFDTQTPANRADSIDAHGLGGIYSAALSWYTDSRFIFQLRGNWIDAVNNFNSFSVMGAIGFQLDKPAIEGPIRRPPHEEDTGAGNQLTLLVGDAVLNRAHAVHTFASSLEYRRGLSPHFDVSLQAITEDSRDDQRYGLAGQLWAVRSFFHEHLSFGIGVGPYAGYDKNRGPDGSTTVNGLIGLTGGLRIGKHVMVRAIWDRVLTNYDHDADIFLAGLGYRF